MLRMDSSHTGNAGETGVTANTFIIIAISLLMLSLFTSSAHASEYHQCVHSCYQDKTSCYSDCYTLYCGGGCGSDYLNCTDICDDDFDLCHSACGGIDEDSDGISDFNDSLIGSEDDVSVEGMGSLEVFVGGYQSNESSASTVTGTQTVTFMADNETVLEFEQDFTNSSLNLLDVHLKEQEAHNRHGIVVGGINGTTVPTKTVYLEKRLGTSSLCVKDAEVEDIKDISDGCQGKDEYFFGKCEDGETYDGIKCSIVNNKYKIEGLKHSGAVEMNISGIYSGFFTVKYLNTATNHKDGYLNPGEEVEIYFESARPILDDESLKFVFVPLYGGLSVNEMYTPHTINLYNVHIYP